jgi:hypothetical protein
VIAANRIAGMELDLHAGTVEVVPVVPRQRPVTIRASPRRHSGRGAAGGHPR